MKDSIMRDKINLHSTFKAASEFSKQLSIEKNATYHIDRFGDFFLTFNKKQHPELTRMNKSYLYDIVINRYSLEEIARIRNIQTKTCVDYVVKLIALNYLNLGMCSWNFTIESHHISSLMDYMNHLDYPFRITPVFESKSNEIENLNYPDLKLVASEVRRIKVFGDTTPDFYSIANNL